MSSYATSIFDNAPPVARLNYRRNIRPKGIRNISRDQLISQRLEFQLEKTLIQQELQEAEIFRLEATVGSQSTVARNGGHRIGGTVMRGSISIIPGSQLVFQA